MLLLAWLAVAGLVGLGVLYWLILRDERARDPIDGLIERNRARYRPGMEARDPSRF